MKVSNGCVWSKKYKCWRKLPRPAWLRIQRDQFLKIQKKQPDKQGRNNNEKT